MRLASDKLERAKKKHDALLFGFINLGKRHTWRIVDVGWSYEIEECIVCGLKKVRRWDADTVPGL